MRLRALITEVYSQDNVALLRYLKHADLDVYQYWYAFRMWAEDMAKDGDEAAEEIERTIGPISTIEDEEPQEFYKLSSETQQRFMEWLRSTHIDWLMKHDPAEAPTWAHLDLQRQRLLPRNTWLIHFTDDPMGIARSGFTLGVDEMDKLGLTTYFKNDGHTKKYGGYNFAFIADSRETLNAARQHKYGRHAVVFQNSGVSVYHYGDEEHQVIFHGKDVNPQNVVPIFSDGDEWTVPDYRTSRVIFAGDISKVVGWIAANFNQYRAAMTKGLPPVPRRR